MAGVSTLNHHGYNTGGDAPHSLDEIGVIRRFAQPLSWQLDR